MGGGGGGQGRGRLLDNYFGIPLSIGFRTFCVCLYSVLCQRIE